MVGTRFCITCQSTGKEMRISNTIDTDLYLIPPVSSCKNLTCCTWQRHMPTGACMSICINLTSFHMKFGGRKYHNVLIEVKPFYCIYFCFVVLSANRFENTSQDLQISIFSFQLFCTWPSQTVPFINQQRSPALSSQAGHCFLWSGEHFLIAQHGLRRLRFSSILETRKYICRSTEAGMDRQSCS